MTGRRNYAYELEIVARTDSQPRNDAATRPQISQSGQAESQSSYNFPSSTSFSVKVVDSFVLTMKAWFDLWLVKSFRARGSGAASSRNCPPCTQRLSQSQPETSSHKRCREEENSGDSDNESEDNRDKRNPQRKRAKTTAAKATNFGCPFFKRDPVAHQRYQSCSRPGFPTVHRVKQHLYKRHRLPEFSCPRCFESFPNNTSLVDHARSLRLCAIREPPMIEGLSKTQETDLKKRSKNSLTESQRWVEIYLLLFPGESRQTLPSPYIDHADEEGTVEPFKPCNSLRCLLQDNCRDLEQFLFCQSRRHLIKQLKEAGGQLSSLLRHPEESKVVEIIPKVLIGLLRDYHDRNRNNQESPESGQTSPNLGYHNDADQQSELDDLAQHLPTDLGVTQLNPFSTMPLPPIPTDILSSLDWLSQTPGIDFESFCHPPSMLDFGSSSGLDSLFDSQMGSELSSGFAGPVPEYGSSFESGPGGVGGPLGMPTLSGSMMKESPARAVSSSTVSLDSEFSMSTNSFQGFSRLDAEVDSLLSDVSID